MSFGYQSEAISISEFENDDSNPDSSAVPPLVAVRIARAPQQSSIGAPVRDSALIRIVDVLGASMILLVTLPMLAILAVLLLLDSRGPLFFVQQRIGRGGKSFACVKFRTMQQNADALLAAYLRQSSTARADWDANFKLRNDPRVTRFGAFVRKFSLDEFPQLINVLRGDMSLVGPRPIIQAEVERYGSSFAHYCRVRPGLTGLWQVSGRNNVRYRRRVSMDRYYARRASLMLNVAILMRTVPAVMFARGAC
jgi:lipopolysaccharide/colanic/teichoic acid biosynthesis glycosyltransferase